MSRKRERSQSPSGRRVRSKNLDEGRKALPIWPYANDIRSRLTTKDILLLVGETGSGKSTQVPQFLLPQSWCTKCIAITQPRRVAAISLARRVAEEMGYAHLQQKGCPVGYSVRFDTMVTDKTRIKFLTEGMLLQEMLSDPSLSKYSAVIVDEVHERSLNVDLLLGFLRNIAYGDKSGRKGEKLKVVVMSATADVELLHKFFSAGAAKSTSNSISNSQLRGKKKKAEKEVEPAKETSDITTEGSEDQSIIDTCYIKGRQFPVKITYLPQATSDWLEEARKKILDIHTKEPLYENKPGDILAFLPGQDDVESLEYIVKESLEGIEIPGMPKVLPLPLFAALPQVAQQRVFQPAPPRTRKIIISTNIAETSLTVPGVRYVIDCGKAKIKQFRNRLGLDSLLVKPISQSSAQQRSGRAGRETDGHCYRLYTEKQYHQLEKDSTPEILRCDLAGAVLTMKARGVENVIGFPFLSPPPREAMEKALLSLLSLGALNEDGIVSEAGKTMAEMPLSPALGRILIEAAQPERNCLLDVIDIIACLSVEKIFLNLAAGSEWGGSSTARQTGTNADVDVNGNDDVDIDSPLQRKLDARMALQHPDSDHLTYLKTVRAYDHEHADRKAWAERHAVSHRAMQNVMEIRKQLRTLCRRRKLLPSGNDTINGLNGQQQQHEINGDAILQCLLRGFASNTAVKERDGSYKTIHGHQTVAIHPSSVLHGRKRHTAVLFSEFVFTKRSYARGVSAVKVEWLNEVLT